MSVCFCVRGDNRCDLCGLSCNEPVSWHYQGAQELKEVKVPHTCPVCGGNGLVPAGFYLTVTGQITTSSCAPETCRSCMGKGFILV